MKKVMGTAMFAGLAAVLWLGAPVAAIGFSAVFRPDYHVRDFSSEYIARLRPNRVHWYDFKAHRLHCDDGMERRVVLLQTIEFAETRAEFLSRTYPECPRWEEEEYILPQGISGTLIGRW